MTDREMRGILIEYLMIKNRHYRIFQEKNIGSSVCDVMLVTDRLCGFEIKSDSDNLERIGRQVEAYERFFDENTIVVGKKYRDTGRQKLCSLVEFEIYTPERQSPSKPSLYIGRGGAEYCVEFGASLKGNITRLKNFLRGFEKLINNMKSFCANSKSANSCCLNSKRATPTPRKRQSGSRRNLPSFSRSSAPPARCKTNGRSTDNNLKCGKPKLFSSNDAYSGSVYDSGIYGGTYNTGTQNVAKKFLQKAGNVPKTGRGLHYNITVKRQVRCFYGNFQKRYRL